MIGIGIDTGGTYTDAVVYDMEAKRVLCFGKTLTTKNKLEIGIAAALDELDPKYVKQAELLALSTTLATNACVEDKGSRAKLLMIGAEERSRENYADAYRSYGFRDPDQIVFIGGKPERIYRHPEDPDWESLRRRAGEEFAHCDAVGVVQMFPDANGGRFEKQARRLLAEELGVPVTTACEMFDEVDVLKRGAGTLLNARLIPLIAEFLEAVKHVMRDRGIDVPIAIVRSDGSLMSELLAGECPVETMLSGPAASVIGGSAMTDERDAVIVDMGGTTTDVALLQDGHPVTARTGISIGPWRTMVKGLFVDTFVLGGDSAVRFRDERLFLDTCRVIPLSVLAAGHPEVTGKLRALAASSRRHTRMLHEFYVLQKDVPADGAYSEEELAVCSALRDGPLTPEELAGRLGTDLYLLRTDRLEEEGVVIRSGLTPTDMMVLKGDFTIYEPDAAMAALEFISLNTGLSPERIPEEIYDLVEKKLYCNIVRILLQQKYPKKHRVLGQSGIDEFIEWSYRDAKDGGGSLMSTAITTSLPIIGVGAPIHVFLPRVAALLGTRAVIRENAPVANALGAIASRIVTRVRVSVRAEYRGAEFEGFSVYEDDRLHMFSEYDDAESFARELVSRQVAEKALRQGASENPQIKVRVEKIRDDSFGSGMFFESFVEAVAMDDFQR